MSTGNDSFPSLALAWVELPCGSGRRLVSFRRQHDGGWASDALVAVRHDAGIVPEAIRLHAKVASQAQLGISKAAELVLAASHLRPIAREATILGWAARPGFPCGVAATAPRELWDEDCVHG